MYLGLYNHRVTENDHHVCPPTGTMVNLKGLFEVEGYCSRSQSTAVSKNTVIMAIGFLAIQPESGFVTVATDCYGLRHHHTVYPETLQRGDFTRFCQPTQPITCANYGNLVQSVMPLHPTIRLQQ